MIDMIRKNIESTIANLEIMAVYFYQQKNEEANEMLNPLFGQLGNTMDEIAYLAKEQPELPIEMNEMNHVLNKALQALQEKDTILFSDIINFEFLVQLRVLLKAI